MKEHGNQELAIKEADKLVRKTQPHTLPSSLSQMHRGGERRSPLIKLATMFYSFFSKFRNNVWQTHQRYKVGDINTGELFISYLWLITIPSILATTITELLRKRRLPNIEELAAGMVAYIAGQFPIFRDIVNSALTGWDYSPTPASRAGEEFADTAGEVWDAMPWTDGDFELGKFAKHGTMAIGYGFGLPTGQMLITGEGFYNLATGRSTDLTDLLVRKSKEK